MKQDLQTQIAIIEKHVSIIIHYLQTNTHHDPSIMQMIYEAFSFSEDEEPKDEISS